MSDNVLDLIDGAIEQYGDAMRWSPDPEKATALPTLDGEAVAAAVVQLNAELHRSIRAAFDAMRPMFEAFREAMQRLAKAVAPLTAEVQDTRRARLRRMHAMYRARRR